MNYAFVTYSGGKDSHIALYHAIKDRNKVILFHAEPENKIESEVLFNSTYTSDIVYKQAEIMGLPIITIKVKNRFILKDIFEKIIKILREEIKITQRIFYYDSSYYSLEKGDIRQLKVIKNILKTNNINFIPFKNIINGDNTFNSIDKSFEIGIKSIITGVEKELLKDFVGKELNNKFRTKLKNLIGNNYPVDANNYQTLVVSSPLFKGCSFKITKSYVSYNSKTKSNILRIVNWKCSKNGQERKKKY